MWPLQQRWDEPGAWDNPHRTPGLCRAAHEEFTNIIPGRMCLKCKHRQFSLIRGSSFKRGDEPELISASGFHCAWEMPAPPGLSAAAKRAGICAGSVRTAGHCDTGEGTRGGRQGKALSPYGSIHPFPQKNGNMRGAVLFHHRKEGSAGLERLSSSLWWSRTWKLNPSLGKEKEEGWGQRNR